MQSMERPPVKTLRISICVVSAIFCLAAASSSGRVSTSNGASVAPVASGVERSEPDLVGWALAGTPASEPGTAALLVFGLFGLTVLSGPKRLNWRHPAIRP
jgi:hypothetical protein